MRRRSLVPRRRIGLRPHAAFAAALVAHAAIVGLVLWIPSQLGPVWREAPAPRATDHASSLTFMALPRSPTATPATRPPSGVARGAPVPADSSGLDIGGAAAAPFAADTGAVTAARSRPAELLDSPFVRPLDQRLLAPFVHEVDSLAALRGLLHVAFAEALARERAASAASDWTVGTGDARFGLTPGRLHLGRVVIPLPVNMVSLRDVDPRVRQQRSMLREARDQGERRWRDSVVAAPRRP